MQFSESWLRSLVNPSLSSEQLAHLLTMAGLEVEEMTAVAPPFNKVVVAEVLTKDRHPDADRLNVLTVNIGQGEPLTIVCGAQNVTVGMKAPCALVGAKLPSSDIEKPLEIKQAQVRGVASFGMMCSAKELGLAEQSDGLMELTADAIVGKSIRAHLDLDDHLITLKLTPNRNDCLSLHGIAREVAGADRHTVAANTWCVVQTDQRPQLQGQGDGIRRLSTIHRACDRGRERKGGNARMDGAAPGALRIAQHQRAGGRDQLCAAGTGATPARF